MSAGPHERTLSVCRSTTREITTGVRYAGAHLVILRLAGHLTSGPYISHKAFSRTFLVVRPDGPRLLTRGKPHSSAGKRLPAPAGPVSREGTRPGVRPSPRRHYLLTNLDKMRRVGLSALITPRDEMTVLMANTKRHSSRLCESCNRLQAVPRPGGAENFTRTNGGMVFTL